MTVAEAQQRVGAREFQRWKLLGEIEPFGDERADYHAGIITSNLFNALVPKARTKPTDFIPRWRREPSPKMHKKLEMERLRQFLMAKSREPAPKPRTPR